MDRYSGQWVAAHKDTCEATHVRGEQSAELLDSHRIRFTFTGPHAQPLEDFFWPPIPSHVYRDVPAHLHALAERSLYAHLLKLEQEGRTRSNGGSWSPVS